ncbi:hypothetical protein AND_000741 [Anopheles darlingi]|uniref:Uncharacterized protein n=1 Tax=Anopheles darlingi TaxID=43151 RepID=W5JWA0_ANODA|nr:hypothetical protein AND_000741 [Anopheles darlingi]
MCTDQLRFTLRLQGKWIPDKPSQASTHLDGDNVRCNSARVIVESKGDAETPTTAPHYEESSNRTSNAQLRPARETSFLAVAAAAATAVMHSNALFSPRRIRENYAGRPSRIAA